MQVKIILFGNNSYKYGGLYSMAKRAVGTNS